MKTLSLVFQVLVLTLLFSCNRELNYLNETPVTARTTQTPPDPISAGLQGTVVDTANNPIAGAMVKVGNATVLTNADGFFKFDVASLDRNTSTIIVTKPGFLTGIRSVAATSGTNQVRIKLVRRRLMGVFNTNTLVIVGSGGLVGFPQNSNAVITIDSLRTVFKSNNQPYSGRVHFYVSYIDPTDPEIATTMPGDLVADDSTGTRVLLKSYGMTSTELETPTGEALQLAPGVTASIQINIPPTLISSAPARIPLWYLNENTGIWIQEGFALKNGAVYTGVVSHFSFWNCDIPVPAIILDMRFVNNNNLPIANTWVSISSVSYGTRFGFTDSLGQIRGLVPANQVLNVALSSAACNNANIYSQTVGPFNTATTLPVITISNTANFTQLTGTVTNCNGQPVLLGILRVKVDGSYFHFPITNGSYTFPLAICNNTTSITFTATDLVASQASLEIPQTIISGSNTIAPIQACGISTIEFINYTIDGVTTTLSINNLAHTLTSFFNANTNEVTVRGIDSTVNNAQILFNFRLAANPLTGPNTLRLFEANGYTNTMVPLPPVPPVLVDVSLNAATVGAYYQGSFSGTFLDSIYSPLHTMSCTFRVKRAQ